MSEFKVDVTTSQPPRTTKRVMGGLLRIFMRRPIVTASTAEFE
jgi:hypothetical protein